MENSKVVIDPNVNWDGLNLEIHFLNPISVDIQKEIKEKISTWAQVGINQGYGDGNMHYEGKGEWDKSGQWYKVWLDMGTADESALNKLEEILLPNMIDTIKVGYEFPDDRYELDDETKQLLDEFEQLDSK
ncbi:MAG: hypothetical protein NTY75_04890 [Candidatus Shapirobacteria bacterium]|nr:hypothetical protein [Candidatus Shapirobacteria bacterium]